MGLKLTHLALTPNNSQIPCDEIYEHFTINWKDPYSLLDFYDEIFWGRLCPEQFCQPEEAQAIDKSYLGATTTAQKRALIWMSRMGFGDWWCLKTRTGSVLAISVLCAGLLCHLAPSVCCLPGISGCEWATRADTDRCLPRPSSGLVQLHGVHTPETDDTELAASEVIKKQTKCTKYHYQPGASIASSASARYFSSFHPCLPSKRHSTCGGKENMSHRRHKNPQILKCRLSRQLQSVLLFLVNWRRSQSTGRRSRVRKTQRWRGEEQREFSGLDGANLDLRNRSEKVEEFVDEEDEQKIGR
jgi:hypothetical protein